ncbi:SusC/RagA family TonB-linked outer membrane protein [Chitinophaga sp. 30R24]|uniref:SusC/RagA family TonB-linked outer membrane protein n=1 Tax=Chitinophaga sp. 30R24 TaxID=3248838 RepID=UPI003B8F9211
MYDAAAVKLDEGKRITVQFSETALNEVMAFLLSDKRDLTFELHKKSIHIYNTDYSSKNAYIKKTVDSVPTNIITGRVTDISGNSIPGATVRIKGTNIGTTTDPDGKFRIPYLSKGEIVTISSIGFSSKDVPVNDKNIITQLNPFINTLDETVVIAYGTTTKRMNTSNTSTLKGSEFETQPISNPLLALQGRVPGIYIQPSTGVPGAGISVRIQGQNSIQSGNDPLYVIDGTPYISQLLSGTSPSILGQSGPGMPLGNPLNYINPQDIESIDVLKDADATAIYGSRAANGAILITTKKGKAGSTRANININTGWGKVPKKLHLLNTQQYLSMRHEAISNDNASISPTDYDVNGTWDTTRNTNWQKELLGGTARVTKINAGVSGGDQYTTYLINGGYSKQTNVFPGDYDDKTGSLHFNISNTSLNKKFSIQLSGDYLKDINKLPQVDLTNTALLLSPDAPPLYNADGSLNWAQVNGISTWTNPLAQQLYNRYTGKTDNLISAMNISYQIIPGLKISSNLGYTRTEMNETIISLLDQYNPESRPYNTRASTFGSSTISSWDIEPQISYQHSLSKGIFEVLIGSTIQQRNSNMSSINASGFNSDVVMEDIKSAANITVASTESDIYKYNALFGRINYNWQDKYIINLTARRDGSSRFGSEKQFHNFGAVGIGWIFTNEDFIKNKQSVLSFGKLKASYGTTGNDQILDYRFLNLYTAIPNPGVPYQGIIGLQPTGIPNPYLAWEETRKLNLGIELGFLRDKVIFTANYNHNRSSNQLLAYVLPIFAGYPSITENFPAVVQNTGLELSVNSTNINKRNFTWSTNANLTIPKNKLISFPGLATSSYATGYVVGQPISIQKVFHSLGVDSATGAYLFTTAKGIPTLNPDYSQDRTTILNSAPTFYGGITNNFRYKNIELSFLFSFGKQKGIDYSLGYFPGIFNTNQPTSVLTRWQHPGDQTNIQRFNSNYSLFQSFLNADLYSDANWADASYIRLETATLSWHFPETWCKKIHIQNCRLYVNGQNLFTISNYLGLDAKTQSIYNLPLLRVLSIGLMASL